MSAIQKILCLLLLSSMPSARMSPAAETPLQVRSEPGPLLIQMENARIGVAWTNHLPIAKYLERQNLMNGGGVALGDYDGDGRCDIFLCNKFGASALYRNLGHWRFEDVAARAGVSCTNQISTGAVFADADGDGKLDLFVTAFLGPNAYFRNLGNGTFTNLAEQVGLRPSGGATSQALSDLDGDGDLDLYVNYFGVEALLRDGVSFSTRMVRGQPVVTGRYSKRLKIVEGKAIELGEPDILYRNDGGKFTPVKWEDSFTDEAGQRMAPPADFGLAVQIRDLDLDGDPDIYTCNDFQTPDRIWLNDGKGRFKALPQLALRNRSYASMGVDFADIDRDGDLDFITVEMLSRERQRHLRQSSPMTPTSRVPGEIEVREDVARNGLYVNRGDGTYAELAWFSGVAASDWSWTPIFADIDLDGFEDLLISNGHIHDVNDRDTAKRASLATAEAKREMLREYPALNTENVAYRNLGNLKFQDVSASWGFRSKQVTYGMALADLDGDGDPDIVANCFNAGPLFYKNNSAAPRVCVRLRGRSPNTEGIGARITLRAGAEAQMQEIVAGGRYLSGDEAMRVFAVMTNGPMQVEVTWRDGKRSRIENVQPNVLCEIDEAGASMAVPVTNVVTKPWFEDVTERLNHVHHEAIFDDFERQPLLPRRYSQLGPGLAWFDLDRDGLDDLVIGAGRGGFLTTYSNDGKGGFTPKKIEGKPLLDDSAGLAGTFLNGEPVVLAAIADYESGRAVPPRMITAGKGEQSALFPAASSSPGPIATADVDGDGDLDLFVGGRILPGNYPAPASSAFFRNENGALVKDEAAVAVSGMITSAVFSDLNGDGFPELVTAEEWGPIRIYDNRGGKFTGQREADTRAGWWNSVTTGDMNNDGRLDIVAGNWGRNSLYERPKQGPHWLMFYGELEPGVQGELIEACTDNGIVPWRDLQTLSATMPSLAAVFSSHSAFGNAKLDVALSDRLRKARSIMASTLDSMLYFNEGTRGFRSEPLPPEAQWSPAFGLNVCDFDNDGVNDLFVAQNFFAVRPEDDRMDAGRGLLLRGKENGTLLPVPGQNSGIRVYGEQRGSAVADFDGDGRMDLAVTQNGNATKLYRNIEAAPGLRVRLKGPAQNPCGLGAVLRAKSPAGWGSAREIHGGGGYWSQNSPTQVFPAGTVEIKIRWPGGNETLSAVPRNAAVVTIDMEGDCTVLQ